MSYSEGELNRWINLRAIEWGNWPLFLAQPIGSICLIFFEWYWVFAAVLALNILWATFIRNKTVWLKPLSLGPRFVLLKWLTVPGATIYLFIQHRHITAIIALFWPILVSLLLVLFPFKIGLIEELIIDNASD